MTVALKSFIGPTALLIVAIIAGIAPATAQRRAGDPSERQLVEAVRQLQQDVGDLERYIYNSPPPSETETNLTTGENLPATALLNERADNLEISVRNLTGQVEELNFRVNQLSQRLETVIADFDLRLRSLEGSGPAPLGSSNYSSTYGPDVASGPMPFEAAPVTTGDVTVEVVPLPDPQGPQVLGVVSVASLSGSEDTDFEMGMQMLRQGDFQSAHSMFEGIIQNYPDSGRLGEVNFWLGESLYVQSQFSDAATAYLTSARDYGEGEKAPDSLLKLGMSLAALGQVEQACGAFDQVAVSYPNASERVTRNVAREQAANSCQ